MIYNEIVVPFPENANSRKFKKPKHDKNKTPQNQGYPPALC